MIAAEGDLQIEVGGESLWLLPERAVYWPARRTLLIADPHFGKAATFRASGIPVPTGTTIDAVTRLKALTARTSATCLIFLGDFLHAREGRSPQLLAELVRWRDGCRELELILVRGNHDRHAGDPPAEMTVECVNAPYLVAPFVLTHHPVRHDDGYVIAGHVHPGVRLKGSGRQYLRLPCFTFGAATAVLPAFGDFTGLADVEPEPDDRIFAVAEAGVIAISDGR